MQPRRIEEEESAFGATRPTAGDPKRTYAPHVRNSSRLTDYVGHQYSLVFLQMRTRFPQSLNRLFVVTKTRKRLHQNSSFHFFSYNIHLSSCVSFESPTYCHARSKGLNPRGVRCYLSQSRMMTIIIPGSYHLRQHIDYGKHNALLFNGLIGGDLSKHAAKEAKIGGNAYGKPASPLRC